MKSLAVFLCLALCIIAIHARHYNDRIENEKRDDELTDNVESTKDYRGQTRHRRKRWQMNYGYDYPPPPNPYYPDRRDYDRNQELIPQIWRLLDEISTYVRRPAYPPAPIYVPYPVPYPVPQNCTCNVQMAPTPNVTKRFPDMDDINQNWGIAETNEEEDVADEDGNDGTRPISFDPIKPKTPMLRPQPEVEHGSNQANVKQERVPMGNGGTSKTTNACNAAILLCCSEKQQKACFTRQGCSMTFARGNACTPQSIAAAIDSYRNAYTSL
ncbi:uncharacterized protein LOC114362571 [Ostrinia furnacalis]|uniref:uncharacterized protein LOC114362571 n=1 Tax=Ostrinia furnacalis TaxID=93504 RepID=UPI00104001D5|nr:uncharacterized protein LOC114362571 [Ostrinia furnacalis]